MRKIFSVSGRKIMMLVSSLMVLLLFTAPASRVMAGDLGGVLLGNLAYFFVVKSYLTEQHLHGQKNSLAESQKATGVSTEPAANEMLDRIAARLTPAASAQKTPQPPFSFYVNPHTDFNASCGLSNVVTINLGTFSECNWNEDEVAMIVAHEMAHGQGNHSLKHLDKTLGINLLYALYSSQNKSNLGQVLGLSVQRLLTAKTVVLPDEWEADNNGFLYFVNAGYNPGAAAASFVRVQAKYGDSGRNFVGEILQPGDHPTNSQRIENFSKKMTEYSDNKVVVDGATVKVQGQEFMTAQENYGQLQNERAYLIAGNLARAFHADRTNGSKGENVTLDEEGRVTLAGFPVVTSGENEPAAVALSEKLKQILQAQ